MFRPLLGQDQASLEAELAKAQKDLMRGRAIVSSGAGDVNSAAQIQADALSRIETILHELSFLDPIRYPLDSIARADVVGVEFFSS